MSNVTRKQHTFNVVKKKSRRPLEFVVIGVLLVSVGYGIYYHRLQNHSNTLPILDHYNYSITQTTNTQTKYRKSSFFGTAPGVTNNAYLTDLTESIDQQFALDFKASEDAKITYQYQATAKVSALYGSDKSSEKGNVSVWSKEYILLNPTGSSLNGKAVSIKPTVTIPFATYHKEAERFRNAFAAPVNSELEVIYSVQLTGNVRGTPVNETKVSTIKIPLDQQIFTVDAQFEKKSNKTISFEESKHLEQMASRLEIPIGLLLFFAGLGLIAFGLRERTVKSSHQRRLEKIYRYHAGIIIQAKQPPDLTHKNVVVTKTFDDLLNIEEELKTPIIASKVNDFTTHFFITSDDIIYVYTLGVDVPFESTGADES